MNSKIHDDDGCNENNPVPNNYSCKSADMSHLDLDLTQSEGKSFFRFDRKRSVKKLKRVRSRSNRDS